MRSPSTVISCSWLLGLFALLMTLCGGEAIAQSSPSFGRRFLVVFPDTAQSHSRIIFNTLQPDATLTFYSLDTTRVTVTAPGFSYTTTVVPERSSSVSLYNIFYGSPKIFTDIVDAVQRSVFEVRADKPIAVTAYFVTIYGGESFTPLPVEHWGTEYFAASLDQGFIFHAMQLEEKYTFVFAPSELIVVASEDSTDVTITASTVVAGPSVRTVRLNSGEAYLLESAIPIGTDTTKRDLSGTHITASKPVGVLSGNTRTLGSLDNPIPLDPLPTNSMSSTDVDWLAPVELHGNTFAYRQFSTVKEDSTTELIRVYGTSPGITTVTTTNGGPPMPVAQGSFLEFSSRKWRTGRALEPFVVRTDKPAQCFLWSGAIALQVGASDTIAGRELETLTWSPAMTELVPRERWITLGRVFSPAWPPGMFDFLVIVADSGATVQLDGLPVTFDSIPITGTTYQHVRLAVSSGDHLLRSTGGRFTATAFGQRRGYAAFRPLQARSSDEPPTGIAPVGESTDRASLLHASEYLEVLALSYAMPVPGVSDFTPEPDSLTLSRVDHCDSSVVIVNRLNAGWSSSILQARLDPTSSNVDALIEPTFNNKIHNGFRIRFMPRDPDKDADGAVIITNDAGQTWRVPYSYRAYTVSVDPSPIEFLAVPAGVGQSKTLTFTNQKPFVTTVLRMHLRQGNAGFSLPDLSMLPKTLLPGGSFQVPLAFTGTTPGQIYRDTLVVISDCDSFAIPLVARTAPASPEAVPLITGYDWGARRLLSLNDTLSFISNAGSAAFSISSVTIINDASGAFALVPPDWSNIPAVQPAERYAAGIRFVPPFEGDFTATILLVTTDGDSAAAPLHGVGIAARIDIANGSVNDLCIGDQRDVTLILTASGDLPTRVDSITVASTPTTAVELDTTGLWLPHTMFPDESLPVRLRITGRAVGPVVVTATAHTDAVGDSLGRVSGVVIDCGNPTFVVTDHDFDTVLVTLSRSGSVVARNVGGGSVRVDAIRLVDDAEGSFAITPPVTPVTLNPTDSIVLPAVFTPRSIGPKSARVEWTSSLGVRYSLLSGIGAKRTIPISISRNYRGKPGTIQTFVVELGDTLRGVRIDSLTVAYDPGLLDFIGEAPPVNPFVAIRALGYIAGEVRVGMNAPDTLAPGPVVGLRFLVRISTIDSSELPLDVLDSVPWMEFVESPGLFTRDPWCGLQERQFEFIAGTFALHPVRPNPVEGAATIEIELPFDGSVELSITDVLGREVLRPLEGYVAAGRRMVIIPAGALPSGIYGVRLRSGAEIRSGGFVVR